MAGLPDDFQQRLDEYLEGVLQQSVRILNLRRMVGGISRDTWQVDAKTGDLLYRLVLQLDLNTSVYAEDLERDQEVQVVRVMQRIGVPVPTIYWQCNEPLILGAPFILVELVENVLDVPTLLHAPEHAALRDQLPAQLAQQLAQVHQTDPALHKLDFIYQPARGASPAQDALDKIQRALRRLNMVNPTLAFGLHWLENHVPDRTERAFIHGDFRLGNWLITPAGLTALIDWENARISDPLEDLAWACLRVWRNDQPQLTFAGVAPQEAFIRAYEAAVGREVDRDALQFWAILGNLRWAVAALSQTHRHFAGDYGVERVSQGRRSAEAQWEMLRLIAAAEDARGGC